MEAENLYTNRAEINTDCAAQATDTSRLDCCGETLVFAMKVNEHQFSLGLSTVLECLMIAEKEGYVPPLPPDWWYPNLTRG